MRKVTLKELRDGAFKAKAERSDDYVHTDICAYGVRDSTDDDFRPGCLIGAGLVNAGVSLRELTRIDIIDEDATIFSEDRASRIGLSFYLDDTAIEWALRAQELQDSQETWGSAVHAADAVIPLRMIMEVTAE